MRDFRHQPVGMKAPQHPRDLPKDLAQAFRATLAELQDADLLLRVVDSADPDREAQIVAVERILKDLDLASTPRLLVYTRSIA